MSSSYRLILLSATLLTSAPAAMQAQARLLAVFAHPDDEMAVAPLLGTRARHSRAAGAAFRGR